MKPALLLPVTTSVRTKSGQCLVFCTTSQGKGCIEQADLRLLPPARDRPVAEAPCPALPCVPGGWVPPAHSTEGTAPKLHGKQGSLPSQPCLCSASLHLLPWG